MKLMGSLPSIGTQCENHHTNIHISGADAIALILGHADLCYPRTSSVPLNSGTEFIV